MVEELNGVKESGELMVLAGLVRMKFCKILIGECCLTTSRSESGK